MVIQAVDCLGLHNSVLVKYHRCKNWRVENRIIEIPHEYAQTPIKLSTCIRNIAKT